MSKAARKKASFELTDSDALMARVDGESYRVHLDTTVIAPSSLPIKSLDDIPEDKAKLYISTTLGGTVTDDITDAVWHALQTKAGRRRIATLYRRAARARMECDADWDAYSPSY